MNIFCYGSLMWPDLWQHEVRNQYPAKDAILKNYRCRRVKGSFEPGLIRSPNHDDVDYVAGKLYLDVNERDFEAIVAYHGKNYEVLEGVCFTSETETPVSCMLFLWRSEQRAFLSDEDWHKEWFEEKALGDYRRKINQSMF